LAVTQAAHRHLKEGSQDQFERSAKMPESDSPEAKRIACAEIVPDCPFTASAATEEELMAKVAAHAARDHGITTVSPELAAKVKAAIKSW
jgi:predicted small metal-binding protein